METKHFSACSACGGWGTRGSPCILWRTRIWLHLILFVSVLFFLGKSACSAPEFGLRFLFPKQLERLFRASLRMTCWDLARASVSRDSRFPLQSCEGPGAVEFHQLAFPSFFLSEPVAWNWVTMSSCRLPQKRYRRGGS